MAAVIGPEIGFFGNKWGASDFQRDFRRFFRTSFKTGPV